MGDNPDEPLYPDDVQFTRTRADTQLARKLRREASKTEKKLWPHLRSAKMGASFRRQHRIGRPFTDYVCLEVKLVVEVDGPTHDPAEDSIRDHGLNERGFDVIRFGVQEIDANFQGVLDTIHREVHDRLTANSDSRR